LTSYTRHKNVILETIFLATTSWLVGLLRKNKIKTKRVNTAYCRDVLFRQELLYQLQLFSQRFLTITRLKRDLEQDILCNCSSVASYSKWVYQNVICI